MLKITQYVMVYVRLSYGNDGIVRKRPIVRHYWKPNLRGGPILKHL